MENKNKAILIKFFDTLRKENKNGLVLVRFGVQHKIGIGGRLSSLNVENSMIPFSAIELGCTGELIGYRRTDNTFWYSGNSPEFGGGVTSFVINSELLWYLSYDLRKSMKEVVSSLQPKQSSF